jgi:hypothetical protein
LGKQQLGKNQWNYLRIKAHCLLTHETLSQFQFRIPKKSYQVPVLGNYQRVMSSEV